MSNVHLYLRINGNDIEGESTVTSLERAGSIECESFFYELSTPRAQATGALTGRRQHGPLTCVKRVDKTSPLLLKALCQNESIEGEFRFFGPNPMGDGSEMHIYTVGFRTAYVSDVREELWSDQPMNSQSNPLMERVSFVFQDIRWVWQANGAEHMDSWRGEA